MMQEVWHGDCLDLLKNIPDKSVQLIIIDPPYFKIKTDDWDNQWDNTNFFLDWLDSVVKELVRVTKFSCSFYCFCYPKLSYEIESVIRTHFTVLNNLVWEKENDRGFDGWKQKCDKESLRKFYPNSERIIFAENKNTFGDLLKKERLASKLSTIKLAELIGAYGKVNHGGSVANWENNLNIPAEVQYEKLQEFLNLPDRKEIIRCFNAKADVQYSDVLHYKTVKPYKGKHPCEKPLDLIEHLVSMSSNEGDLVLDCFMGSGTTCLAAKRLRRQFVGIEKNEEYYKLAVDRLSKC